MIYRNIFSNKFCMKNKQMDNDNVKPDPDSICSMAKRVQLARAEEQWLGQQATEE